MADENGDQIKSEQPVVDENDGYYYPTQLALATTKHEPGMPLN